MLFESKVPVALDGTGTAVTVHDMSIPPYTCPACHCTIVSKRQSPRARRHFSHVAGGGGACEGYAHVAAKLIVARKWTELRLQSKCKRCSQVEPHGIPSAAARSIVEGVVETTVGTARADVLLVDNEKRPVAAIEIFDTHAVEEATASVYAAATVACIELNAWTVLRAFDNMPVDAILCRRILPAVERCAACVAYDDARAEEAKWRTEADARRQELEEAERRRESMRRPLGPYYCDACGQLHGSIYAFNAHQPSCRRDRAGFAGRKGRMQLLR